MTATQLSPVSHKVVSRGEWIQARRAHLAAEKEFTRQRDELSRMRRELPWVRVDKNYTFATAQGTETLADLFGSRSQLIVYHFMLGPTWEEGCPSCSFLADHIDGSLVHLENRDVSMVVSSRAPLDRIQAFQNRMGWRFKWVSAFRNDFNRDFHVSFTQDEMAAGKVYYNYDQTQFPSDEAPGVSVFFRNDAGEIFHTYSSYARGLDMLVGAYNYLDLVPKGRDEGGLDFTMSWVRHHDRYTNQPGATGTQVLEQVASCCSAEQRS
ncbi:MAG TPA: thioredoxin family protein [Bryobacteraceae bacterium]|nr:thioredoxin family protein [Bryobacteraceae bacterium]